MIIKYFCPRWGSEHLSWEDFCAKVKLAGYDGVEAVIPFDPEELELLKQALKNHDLLLIGQYYQSFEKDFQSHLEQYIAHLKHIAELKPMLIDAQTGKDYYSQDQNAILFQEANKISESTEIPIAHETHRNKALFAAHIAAELLKRNPDVSITADFSHWCNVSESLLEQQDEDIDIAISRTIHIHARVGHAQSAQVTDPRAPEWDDALQAHLKWWDRIVHFRKESKTELLTITPEFGPVPYMNTLPYTMMPVADQWTINLFMMRLLKGRY